MPSAVILAEDSCLMKYWFRVIGRQRMRNRKNHISLFLKRGLRFF